MKTRIISAIIGIGIFAVVLVLSIKNPIVILVALALLNVIATYEMLHNTKLLKSAPLLVAAMIFAAAFPFCITKASAAIALTVLALFVLAVAVIAVIRHTECDAGGIFTALGAPLLFSLAFSSIYLLFVAENMAHFYFVLIFMFSWGADTAAYFGGTFFGKHKLAPVVSPKKTYEGSVFGVLGSVLLTVIVGLIYTSASVKINWAFTLISAVVFSVVGMIGDLFTSQIKRDRGIKDYGNIMPGHGGVLDRFDSVLLISPLFYLFLRVLEII